MLHPSHLRCFITLTLISAALFIVASWTSHSAWNFVFYPLGLCSWTLFEYLLHRFLFHLSPQNPWSLLGARHHHSHHLAPEAMPITKPLFLTLPAFALAFLSTYAFIPFAPLSFFTSGLFSGYFIYELSHVAAHLLPPSRHPRPSVQAHHLSHHRNEMANFGITQSFWDRVFRTYQRNK